MLVKQYLVGEIRVLKDSILVKKKGLKSMTSDPTLKI